jgi:hypothetical protein
MLAAMALLAYLSCLGFAAFVAFFVIGMAIDESTRPAPKKPKSAGADKHVAMPRESAYNARHYRLRKAGGDQIMKKSPG